MVGAPMLKAERISCSGPKLSDAQTRNFEAIKYTMRFAGDASKAMVDVVGGVARAHRASRTAQLYASVG